MKTEKFNYDLPEHLIAQYPSSKRTNSKLLVALESIQHQVFKDIGNHLNKGDLLILNKTSVIPARLFGEKVTGGKIELLLERFLSNQQTLTQIRSSRTPKEGAELVFSFQGQRFLATVEGRQDNFFILNWSDDPKSLFEQYGQIPLPPYMNRAAEKLDEERYETIYADPDQKASVAAPTAGMHFDQELLNSLQKKGVEFGYVHLHVGAGTFQPVKTDHIEDHVIHKELVEVDASLIDQVKRVKASNGKIIAVGTTSVRAIETAFQDEPSAFKGETSLFIYPGYKFKVVDHMITNFHLPKSSLLMLVAAFIGYEKMMTIYETAIEQEYRFLSYGDAMLLKYHEI
ncbi:MAG: tRNA preQ1(34) S-adenosylmethionine ribosyltransferase-isomerase QueA [Gammaproteobacteria bacterium]|jgi:S-adenosylmethionine:tRNA ribosyltransferase-isomerase|nr:tRNA preQ1(34) S-adenosylmethionine ribosyltransferase-isomerase QueA [Gammaproteobacteria bacterium]MDC1147350.1 tRNA preQ1(34) S-adenosylmethionine ribosyltransferase-isomerase QueA [Gammaproteobacteria bacterium]